MNKYLNNKYVLYCIFKYCIPPVLGYRRDGMWVNTSVKLASSQPLMLFEPAEVLGRQTGKLLTGTKK